MTTKNTKATETTAPVKTLLISPPNFQKLDILIRGTAQYVQLAFSEKAQRLLLEKHQAGDTAKGKKKREAKDVDELFEAAQHCDHEKGWNGIPAPAFRNAMISACRIVNFAMTRGKLALFVDADGVDSTGTPLVKLDGKPVMGIDPVRNADGSVDMRVRAKWPQWKCKLRVRYDGDMFTAQDVVNLVSRAGVQVGVGEGRPDSRKSCGMGWGTFEIVNG
jgi:hypothetical protein